MGRDQDREAIQRVLDGRSWEEFCDRLTAAGDLVFRDEAPATPQDRAEGLRYVGLPIPALPRLFGLLRPFSLTIPDFPSPPESGPGCLCALRDPYFGGGNPHREVPRRRDGPRWPRRPMVPWA